MPRTSRLGYGRRMRSGRYCRTRGCLQARRGASPRRSAPRCWRLVAKGAAMDEAGSVPLHRWLSFCRVLMLFHPRVGARNYASHLFGPTDLKPGWNAVYSTPGAELPVHYIFIPIGSGEGKNTEKKPDVPDSEIHDSYESDLPPFDGSLARRHLLLLGEMLVVQNIPDYGAAQLQETTAAIDAAAQQPLRGPTASVDERIGRDLGRLKQAIQSGESVVRLTE